MTLTCSNCATMLKPWCLIAGSYAWRGIFILVLFTGFRKNEVRSVSLNGSTSVLTVRPSRVQAVTLYAVRSSTPRCLELPTPRLYFARLISFDHDLCWLLHLVRCPAMLTLDKCACGSPVSSRQFQP